MTDDRFDDELRAFLARRAPVGVSPVLRARLATVTAETPRRRWSADGRAGAPWRAIAGLVATGAIVAAAAVLLALLLGTDRFVIRDPSIIGAPSAAPVGESAPFVLAPNGVFSAAAMEDAERRLRLVSVDSRIDTSLIVQAETSATQLSTPEGWPGRFDRDGDGSRDIATVIGMAPDGTIVCCLTITGDRFERARSDGYWRPQSRPDRLRPDLESDDQAVRDAALDRFVDGIVGVSEGMALVDEASDRDTTIRVVGLGALGLVVLTVLVVVGTRRAPRRPWTSTTDATAADVGLLPAPGVPDAPVVPDAPSVPAGAVPDAGADPAADAADAAAGPTDSGVAVAWASPDRAASLTTSTLLAIAAAGMLGVLGLAAWDAIRPTPAPVPLDVTAATIGVALPALPLVPLALVGLTVVALAAVAWRGGRVRRAAITGIIVLGVGLGLVVLDATRPGSGSGDRAWVAGVGAGAVDHFGPDLHFDVQTFPLDPDAPFTVATTFRNPGPVPMTIVGLDGIQPNQPNGHVASIVGIGWVRQPTDDGEVRLLSAEPAAASASWPVTVGPGEELALVLVGRAGPCAQPDGTGATLPITSVSVTYRVLGIELSEELPLPVGLVIPARTPCTVQVEGGSVTYER